MLRRYSVGRGRLDRSQTKEEYFLHNLDPLQKLNPSQMKHLILLYHISKLSAITIEPRFQELSMCEKRSVIEILLKLKMKHPTLHIM